jgi:hypothetical protein
MRRRLKDYKRAAVEVALFLGAALTYYALSGTPWASYAALCVAYTVLVVGRAWTDGKTRLYFDNENGRMARFLQIHLGFLLAAMLILWFALRLKAPEPELPDSSSGDSGTWRLVTVVVLFYGMVAIERYWIEKRPRRDAN